MQEESIRKIEEIYQLWGACFGDSKEYTDFYFKWKVGNNQILTIYDRNVLVSMLHLNPYRFMLREREVSSNYIVGVATKTEYRKQGYMRQILTKALQDMWMEGMEFTYLMPAAERIYTPYSFRYVYSQERANVLITQTDYAKTEDYLIQQLDEKCNRRIDKQKIECILLKDSNYFAVYEELVTFSNNLLQENFDCYAKRNMHYYQRMQEEMMSAGGEIVLLYKEEKFIGYFAYMQTGDAVEIVESIVDPSEMLEAICKIYLYFVDLKIKLNDEKAASSVAGLDSRNDNQKGLSVTFLETHFLKDIDLIIDNIKLISTSIIMARIVHFEEFIKHITAKKDVSFVLKVIDNDLKQNEGTYRLDFSTIGCEVVKTNEKEELTLNISDLTKILFGSALLEECVDKMDISKDIIEKWKLINNYCKLYINEIV